MQAQGHRASHAQHHMRNITATQQQANTQGTHVGRCLRCGAAPATSLGLLRAASPPSTGFGCGGFVIHRLQLGPRCTLRVRGRQLGVPHTCVRLAATSKAAGATLSYVQVTGVGRCCLVGCEREAAHEQHRVLTVYQCLSSTSSAAPPASACHRPLSPVVRNYQLRAAIGAQAITRRADLVRSQCATNTGHQCGCPCVRVWLVARPLQ